MTSRLSPEDYEDVAQRLVKRHGDMALLWADLAIDDLESKGEEWRAEAWRAVRQLILDMTGVEPSRLGRDVPLQ